MAMPVARARLRQRPLHRGPIYPCRDVVGSLRRLAGVRRPCSAAPGTTLVRCCTRLAHTGRTASLVATCHRMSPIAACRHHCESGGHRCHRDCSTTAPSGVRRFVLGEERRAKALCRQRRPLGLVSPSPWQRMMIGGKAEHCRHMRAVA
jgi:hypothetical protein